MTISNVVAVLFVSDLETAVSWYQVLFDRPPDRRPLPHAVEWQLSPGGAIQLYRSDEGTGMTARIEVDDVEAFVAEASARGVGAELLTGATSGVEVAALVDPSGNTVLVVQAAEESPDEDAPAEAPADGALAGGNAT